MSTTASEPAEGGGRLLESSRRWQPGGRRESITASELHTVEAHGFTVLHHVRWPGKRVAKIDHVVIGGGQVWVISARKWSGSVTVTGGVLKENGRSRQKYVAEVAEATQAIAALSPMLPPSTFHPILCIEKEEWVNERFGDVWICSSINVATVLQTPPEKGPDYLHNDLVRQLEDALKSQATPPPPVPLRPLQPPPDAAGEDEAAPTAKVSRRARRRYLKDTTKHAPSGPGGRSGPPKGVAVLAVVGVAAASLAFFKPDVVTGPVGSLTDSITGTFWPDGGDEAPVEVDKGKKKNKKNKQRQQQAEQPAS